MVFFFNDTATTEIYTLSLHDALPIYLSGTCHEKVRIGSELIEVKQQFPLFNGVTSPSVSLIIIQYSNKNSSDND